MLYKWQRHCGRIFGSLSIVWALFSCVPRGVHGAASWEEMQRYQSSFLELKDSIHVTELTGKKLGTRIDIAVNQQGVLCIADANNRRLLKYSPTTRRMETLALPSDRLVAPHAVAIAPKGRLLLANPDLHEILVRDGSWFRLGGQTGFDSLFTYPVDLEVDSSGRVFVLDQDKQAVLIVEPTGRILRTLKITGIPEKAQAGLTDLALGPKGAIYVLNGDSQQVLKTSRDGTFHTLTKGERPGFFAGVVVSDTGRVFITDSFNSTILEFTSDGDFVREHVLSKRSLQQPSKMAMSSDRLALLNEGKDQILVFTLRSALSGIDHAVLGEEYLAVGYPQQAVHEFSVARKLGYNPPEVSLLLGQAYYAQGEYRRAVGEFERTLQKEPKNINALFSLANSLSKLEAYAEAIKRYRQVLGIDSGHVPALVNLAEVYLATNNPEQAQAYLRQALAFDPQHIGARLGLGRAYLAEGRYTEAAALFARLLKENAAEREAQYFLGMTYFRQREFDKAIPLLERAAARGPYFIDALYHLGLAYAKVGKKTEALREFQRVLELKPDHRDAQQQILALRKG
jgi:tetratricopeptide (TPR) repeat protein